MFFSFLSGQFNGKGMISQKNEQELNDLFDFEFKKIPHSINRQISQIRFFTTNRHDLNY